MILTMVRAIILAAGASTRMGQPKPALRLNGRGGTFLSHLVDTFLSAGLPDIVVVSGADDRAVRAAWPKSDRRVRVIHNADWQRGQLCSLTAGLDAPSPVPIEAAVVHLADVPLVTAETIARLIAVWRETRARIVRPARGEEHGHPVIFDASLFDEVRKADVAVGAKAIVRAHAGEILNVPIDDPGAYLDIDTPEDYARLR